MPRLVSLTLLSLLALPAGTFVYLLTSLITYETLGWQADEMALLLGGLLTFVSVTAWWLLLWMSAVNWTPWRVRWTVIFTIGSIFAGLLIGLAFGGLTGEEEVGILFGCTVPTVLWMGAACVVWRDQTHEAADRSTVGRGDAAIACPKCGYAMTGLREARCPECGQSYTLDALFAAQRSDDRMAEV